jgi:hypothetical protein
VDVQCSHDEQGNVQPVSFRSGSHEYRVEAHLDTWYGGDYDVWYKVRADDGNLYILRYDGARWTLESFRKVA